MESARLLFTTDHETGINLYNIQLDRWIEKPLVQVYWLANGAVNRQLDNFRRFLFTRFRDTTTLRTNQKKFYGV